MPAFRPFLTACLIPLIALPAPSVIAGDDAQPFTIRVHAGPHDRLATPVRVQVGDSRSDWRLTGSDGHTPPHQITLSSELVFRVGRIRAGAFTDYRFGPDDVPARSIHDDLLTHYDTDGLRFTAGKTDLAFYRIIPVELEGTGIDPLYRRAGYLHPLRTLRGVVVTDDFPSIHLHHHGLWSAWTHTAFDGRNPDFWNMGKGSAGVAFMSLEEAWEGPVEAGFIARHEFFMRNAEGPDTPVLHETWTTRIATPVPADGGAWFFDLDLDQATADHRPLELLEYHYGGLSFRGNGAWNGADNARVLTAEGISDRAEANESRSRWCAMSGGVDGAVAGLALLDHPANPRAPQPLRVHPQEPYFCYAPPQLGSLTIAPDSPYRARYRVVVFDGEPDPETLERLWTDFADPPRVEILIPGQAAE